MSPSPEASLRFVPGAVDGLPDVTAAVVFPDRLELLSAGRWTTIVFLDIAQWPWGGRLFRWLARRGFRVRGRPSVGGRDWCQPPARRYFRFQTDPPITVYMPSEAADTGYDDTTFGRVKDVLALGGFTTHDLG